jgi:hypothetical protein
MIELCSYDVCWKGDCDNTVQEGNRFCTGHETLKCKHCGEKAVGDCHRYNGSFVCGAPLCEKCKCGHG